MKLNRKTIRIAALAAAAAASASTALNTFAGNSANNVITISISGSTAMRAFTTSSGFAVAEAGTTLTLSNGTYFGGSNGLQLNPNPVATGNLANSSTGGGIRTEWHEAGSVEGILELANDQIGYFTADGGVTGQIVDANTSRNATSGNPVWINTVRTTTVPASPANGTLNSSTYNTYNTSTTTGYNAAGRNFASGQNRIQWAISDVPATQGFSTAGPASPFAAPSTPGYGKGNQALAAGSGTANIGSVQGRQALADSTLLNMETTKINPETGTNYAAGPWNTAGTGNLVSKTVAITATAIAANPGTGLTSINKTDAQFLQALGRLQNGADFNVATRDVNSGTRNVGALNVGLDPSFAVGENDAGNGFSAGLPAGTPAQQATIGSLLKFSGKTAGGGQLAPTVQNNRMAIGTLGLSDVVGAAGALGGATNTPVGTAVPLRGLKYSDTTYNAAGVDASFSPVGINARSITDGTYKIWQQQQYVFVKRPEATLDGATSVYAGSTVNSYYKGDNTGTGGSNLATGTTVGNVAKVSQTIFDSVRNFPNNTSLNTPADVLLANRFILPQLMRVKKSVDGGVVTDQSSDLATAGLTFKQWNDLYLGDASANNVLLAEPSAITIGSSAIYGKGNSNGAAVYTNNISINSKNYLFGNFNQNGVRDFAAIKAAGALQTLITGSNTMFDTNQTTLNGTIVTTVNGQSLTKGDLIVLGDYNGDGKFDGADLYAMAKGAALSDSTSTETITATGIDGFSAALRTATLRKNAALDFYYTSATAQQRTEAAAGSTAMAIANAFNRYDINRDGVVNLDDALIVDKFAGQNATDLVTATNAVIDATTGKPTVTTSGKIINLFDVIQVDGSKVVTQRDADALGLANRPVSLAFTGTTTISSTNQVVKLRPGAGSDVSATAGASFVVTGGTLAVGADNAAANGGTTRVGFFPTTGNLVSVAVSGTGTLLLDSSGDRLGTGRRPVTVLPSLTITGNGFVGLNVTDLIIKSPTSAYNQINGYINAWYANNAVGLGTTAEGLAGNAIGNRSTTLTTLAIFSNSANTFSQYDGISLTTTSTIVKYTWLGDINLDGKLDGTDLGTILENISFIGNSGTARYQDGDLNADGNISGLDITQFNRVLAGITFGGGGLSFGDGSSEVSSGAIPEPSSIALLAAALPLVSRRRRSAK